MDTKDSVEEFTAEITTLNHKLFESYYGRGLARFNKKDFLGAISDFEDAIKLYPASKESYLALAEALIGHNKGIIAYSTNDMKWFRINSWSYASLAKAKKNLGKSDGMDDFEMAIELVPVNKKAICDMWNSKDFRFDIMECQIKAIELDPEYIVAYVSRADLHLWNENYKAATDYYSEAIRRDQASFENYKKRGDAYCCLAGEFEAWGPLQIHNYGLAISDYTEAIKLKDDYAEAYDARGMVKFLQSNFQASLDDYDHAIRINHSFDQAYHNRAETKINLDDLNGALTDYTLAIQLNSQRADSLFKRAGIYEQNGYFTDAISDYTLAVYHDPKLFEACNQRRVLKIKLFETTIQDCTKAIELNPKDSLAYYHRALAKANIGDEQGANDDSNMAIGLDPNFSDAYLVRGYATWEIEDYSKAISLNPLNHEAYFYRGYRKSREGDLKGAFEDFSIAIEYNPNDDVCYRERGYLSFYLKDYAQAIRDLTCALKINPDDSEPNFNNSIFIDKDQTSWVSKEKIVYCNFQNFKYATIYLARSYANYYIGDYSQSIFNYKRAISLWDDLKDFHFQSILAFQNKDIERAISYIDWAILLNPKDQVLYYNRGIYKIHLSRYKESIEDFSMVISMKETGLNAYIMRGYALCRTSNIYLALADFERAVEINEQYSSIQNMIINCETDILSQEELKFLDSAIDFNPKESPIPSRFF